MKPDEAGRRLILLALPFLAFGLFWALAPPIEGLLGPDVVALTQALGVALALLAFGAIGLGAWLIRSDDERVL